MQDKPLNRIVHVNCGVKRERDTKSASSKAQHKPQKRRVHVNCGVRRERDTRSTSNPRGFLEVTHVVASNADEAQNERERKS